MKNYYKADNRRPKVELGDSYQERLNALPDDHPCKANSGLVFTAWGTRDPQIGGDFNFIGYY